MLVDAYITFPREVVPRANKGRGPTVFEPAVAFTKGHEQEDVAIEIFGCAHQVHMLVAESVEVTAHTTHIDPRPTANRDCVRDTSDLEFTNGEIADFHRMVDQLGIVVRCIDSVSVFARVFRPHRRNDPPITAGSIGWSLNIEFTCMIFLPDNGGKHA